MKLTLNIVVGWIGYIAALAAISVGALTLYAAGTEHYAWTIWGAIAFLVIAGAGIFAVTTAIHIDRSRNEDLPHLL